MAEHDDLALLAPLADEQQGSRLPPFLFSRGEQRRIDVRFTPQRERPLLTSIDEDEPDGLQVRSRHDHATCRGGRRDARSPYLLSQDELANAGLISGMNPDQNPW